MTPRRLAFWLLAAAGVASGHVVGYAAAHPTDAWRHLSLGSHGYLPGVASVVVPVGLVVGLAWAISSARRLDVAEGLTVRRLAAAQLGLFVVQEVGERLVDGVALSALAGSLLGELGVPLGAIAQVAVAALLVGSLRIVRRVVRCLSVTPPRRTARRQLAEVVADRLPCPSTYGVVAVGVRGPPVPA